MRYDKKASILAFVALLSPLTLCAAGTPVTREEFLFRMHEWERGRVEQLSPRLAPGAAPAWVSPGPATTMPLSRGDTPLFEPPADAPTTARAEGDQYWWDGFGQPAGAGLNGWMSAILSFQGKVVVAGWGLASTDGTPLDFAGSWNGTGWSRMGSSGFRWGYAYALTVYQNTLYVGGYFGLPGGISASILQWDGSAWLPFATGPAEVVYTLGTYRGDLVAGGRFTMIGSTPARNLAAWDGTHWSEIGGGVDNGLYWPVTCLAEYDSSLVVGGQFTEAGGTPASKIAAWDGTSWNDLAGGLDANAYATYALAVFQGRLIVGGWFSSAGGVQSYGLAAWDGSSWSVGAPGLGGGVVSTLAVQGDRLLIGGWTYYHADVCARSLAAWDGVNWTEIGGGALNDRTQGHFPAPGPVFGLCVVPGGLYVLGDFWSVGTDPVPARSIAFWNGTSWAALGPVEPGGQGINDQVFALAAWQGGVVAAGVFQQAGTARINGLARWDGQSWSPLGGPQDSTCAVAWGQRALVNWNGVLVASSRFDQNGQQYGVVAWDESSWYPLKGEGQTVSCTRLATYQGALVAGGTAWSGLWPGPDVLGPVLRWDQVEHQWKQLGDALQGEVGGFADGGDHLFAGLNGPVGGQPTGTVYAWDGLQWQALGTADDWTTIRALAMWNGRLVCAGDGPSQQPRIAEWRDGVWVDIDQGQRSHLESYYVRALLPVGSTIFASGNGKLWVDGQWQYIGLVKWNGNEWSTLGSSAWEAGWCLLWDGTDLYVGGQISRAGYKDSRGIARWTGGVDNEPEDGFIEGTVFQDLDHDCQADSSDPGLPGFTLRLDPGGIPGLTNAQGRYRFGPLNPGAYTVTVLPRDNWNRVCPADSDAIGVEVHAGQIAGGADFGFEPATVVEDLAISVVGGASRRGFAKRYAVEVENQGTLPATGTVRLALPPEVTFEASPHGVYSAQDHAIDWDLGLLNTADTKWLWSTVHIPPAVPLGTYLHACGTVVLNGSDADSSDNVACIDEQVTGSYDPNEKRVTPAGWVAPGEPLHYEIEFQNCGTDTAFTVVVRDTLNGNLDETTVHLDGTSHPCAFLRTGRELLWRFSDILLPDSTVDEPDSRGFLRFTVWPRLNLPPGTSVQNYAGIVFDFNEPVATNMVINHVGSPPGEFVRGDVDQDGELNISDPIFNLAYQFAGGAVPSCLDAADDDDSGEVDISDPIYSLSYQFAGGSPPPAPFPSCGPDSTADQIGCSQFPSCDDKARSAPQATKVVDGSKRLLLEKVSGTAPDSLSLTVTVVTDVPLAGLEGMAGFDPSRLRFVRLVQGGSCPRMDFLSAREVSDPARIRLGGVPDFALTRALEPGSYEIGRLVFALRDHETPPDDAVWVIGGAFVGKDLQAYQIEGGPVVDSSMPATPGEASAAGLVLVFPNPYHLNSPIILRSGLTAKEADIAVYDVQGRRVRSLYVGSMMTALRLAWDGRSDSGGEVATGLYYLRASSGSQVERRRLLLLK